MTRSTGQSPHRQEEKRRAKEEKERMPVTGPRHPVLEQIFGKASFEAIAEDRPLCPLPALPQMIADIPADQPLMPPPLPASQR